MSSFDVPRRPYLSRPLTSLPRRLDLFFYTSSETKYQHAKTVLGRFGIHLRYTPGSVSEYPEDYSLGREAMLERAVNAVRARVGDGRLFFVEDTSVRIEALSSPTEDFPGLGVKEWFAATTFAECDRLLRAHRNDRRCLVRSDIAMYVPQLGHSVRFTGMTRGEIATSAPGFAASPTHPWLTPSTFDGWFIPEGATLRLGEMDFERSWDFDFRIRALTGMVARLEEYASIANAPTSAISRREGLVVERQLDLFPHAPFVALVIGRTCAGKTTFGDIAVQQENVSVVEASSVVRMYHQQHASKLSLFAFADELLKERGADFVAREIMTVGVGSGAARGIVITGFRTIEEIEYVRGRIANVAVVLVTAPERDRYHRHLVRGRNPDLRTAEDFRRADEAQNSFGLLGAPEEVADVIIDNSGSKEEYAQRVLGVIAELRRHSEDGAPVVTVGVERRGERARSQLMRSLEALVALAGPRTCEEIEARTAEAGTRVRSTNVNRTLKVRPELARRGDRDGTVTYEVTDAGRALVRAAGNVRPLSVARGAKPR